MVMEQADLISFSMLMDARFIQPAEAAIQR